MYKVSYEIYCIVYIKEYVWSNREMSIENISYFSRRVKSSRFLDEERKLFKKLHEFLVVWLSRIR